MNGVEATAAVIDALESLAIPYMLVGSFSSNYYGIPRSTEDADFVIELKDTPVKTIVGALGSQFKWDPQIAFETITGTTRNVVELLDGDFRVELYRLSADPHDQERFRRRRRITLAAVHRDAYLPTAEDVILTKLRWSQHGQRSKDREDVRDVIAVQGDRIDWNYVHPWCEQHGTRQILDEIRQSIPPI